MYNPLNEASHSFTGLQYRPKSLDELSYHEELTTRLRSLVSILSLFHGHVPGRVFGCMQLTEGYAYRIGKLGRFPSFTCVWAVGSRQEDQDKLRSTGIIWKGCRESAFPIDSFYSKLTSNFILSIFS